MSQPAKARSSRLVQRVVDVACWPHSSYGLKVEVLVVEHASLLGVIAANCTEPVESMPLATLLLAGRGVYESRVEEAFASGRLAERIVLAAAATGLAAEVKALSAEGRKLIKEALGISGEKRISIVVMLFER